MWRGVGVPHPYSGRYASLRSFCIRLLLGVALLAAARLPAFAAPTIDGIRCDRMEGRAFHIHQHLAIFDHGKPVAIPNDIGRPIVDACLYWIHTHTDDGVVHVESPVSRTFTLGDLFDIWGEPLSAKHVGRVKGRPGERRVFLDGSLATGDPRAIELTQHADIVIEIGPPYHRPIPFTDWRGQ